jgi:hypothetical protein
MASIKLSIAIVRVFIISSILSVRLLRRRVGVVVWLMLSQKLKRMAKQKFRPARLGGFSGTKAYIRYVEVLKKRRNAAGRTFCDAIMVES